MNSKKWVFYFAFYSGIILICLMAIAYIIDPFMHYRSTSNKYLLNSTFVNTGVIKNYDYDTVVIGSSMMQNFNMQSFRNKLNCKPIKTTMGGISLTEIQELNKLITHQNRADKMYVCMDLYQLSAFQEFDKMRVPYYLADNNPVNDYRYLLGYEVWMRFIPVDIAINALFSLGIDLPPKFIQSTDVDYLEYWHDDYVFGEDIVKNSYRNSRYSTTKPDTSNLYERMTSRADEYLKTLDFSKENVFFFPPYSALFWHQAQEDNYFDIYQEVKVYIVNELSDKSNVKIYDFQSMPLICDLNNYKDATHYSAAVNEMMVDCFVNGDYLVNNQTVLESVHSLRKAVKQFEQDNQDLFESPPPD